MESRLLEQQMIVEQWFKKLDKVSHELREMYRTPNFDRTNTAKDREVKRRELNSIIQTYEYESKKLARYHQDLHTGVQHAH